MSSRAITKIFTYAGRVLQILSIIFVFSILYVNADQIVELPISLINLLYTGTSVIAICIVVLMLQVFAILLFLRVSMPTLGLWEVLKFFGQTSIAKYFPGNVFHYIGRQVFGRERGWNQIDILSASIAETAVLLSATCAVTLGALLLSGANLPMGISRKTVMAALGLGITVPTILMFCTRLQAINKQPRICMALRKICGTTWITTQLLYIIFSFGGAIAFWICINLLGGPVDSDFYLLIVAYYGLSYLLGFVMPGAPGGIGVREALLILLLSPLLGAAVVSGAAVLHRFCSIIADILLYVCAKVIVIHE